MRAEPLDKKLYEKVKAEAKKRFKSWPSAYGSGWLVQEYKRRGGRYKGSKPSRQVGLGRWFEEEWINVCYYPKIVPCGRIGNMTYEEYWKKFPYCRPLKRITKKTPRTVKELTASQRKKRCTMKRKQPKSRIIPKSRKPRKSKK